MFNLHKKIEADTKHGKQDQDAVGATGILINSAPRTAENNNGNPFYLAQLLRGKIRVVAPLAALSAVKEHVEELRCLPNEANGLYPDHEQFRSSYVSSLLTQGHSVPFQTSSPDTIPAYPQEWRVSYVDRFGNLVSFDNRDKTTRDAIIRVKINECIHEADEVGSLDQGTPGKLLVYRNDGDRNIEVIRKWTPEDSPARRLINSAYSLFKKPHIGSLVDLVNRPIAA